MGRIVKGYEQGSLREYVPKAFGNREDPNPIRVWGVSPEERDARAVYAAAASAKVKVAKDGKPEEVTMDGASFSWAETACARLIKKFEGEYEVRGKRITNGLELARWGESELVYEIAAEFMESASFGEEEKKTSAEPSVSKSPTMPPSDGTAVNVERLVSPSSEDASPGLKDKDSSTSSLEPELSPDARRPGYVMREANPNG